MGAILVIWSRVPHLVAVVMMAAYSGVAFIFFCLSEAEDVLLGKWGSLFWCAKRVDERQRQRIIIFSKACRAEGVVQLGGAH